MSSDAWLHADRKWYRQAAAAADVDVENEVDDEQQERRCWNIPV